MTLRDNTVISNAGMPEDDASQLLVRVYIHTLARIQTHTCAQTRTCTHAHM
jgi:hypothetical protein